MVKFNYHFRLTRPNTSGKCSIILRVSYSGSRTDIYTGITVEPTKWNDKIERIKQGSKVGGYYYNVINDLLSEHEKFIDNYFNDSLLRSVPVSLVDLKARFKHRFHFSEERQSDEFFFLFSKYRKEMAEQNGWNPETIKMYERLQNKVKTFKPDMKFSDLSIETMDKFKVFLSKTMYNDALQKHLQYFKSFITWAKKRKYRIHEEYFTYEPKLLKAQKAVRYLTTDELDTICNLTFEGKDGLERTRDIFVFQCYTALRFSDISKLKRENITKDENGEYRIDILTQKDHDRISFKLADPAVKIYQKYESNVYENDHAFPVISSVRYNDHLKELGNAAQLQGEWIDYEYRLTEKIIVKTPKTELSSHTARRTFIVTAMNEGISLDLIALITSHSDVKAMKPYIKLNTRGTDKVIDALNKSVQ